MSASSLCLRYGERKALGEGSALLYYEMCYPWHRLMQFMSLLFVSIDPELFKRVRQTLVNSEKNASFCVERPALQKSSLWDVGSTATSIRCKNIYEYEERKLSACVASKSGRDTGACNAQRKQHYILEIFVEFVMSGSHICNFYPSSNTMATRDFTLSYAKLASTAPEATSLLFLVPKSLGNLNIQWRKWMTLANFIQHRTRIRQIDMELQEALPLI